MESQLELGEKSCGYPIHTHFVNMITFVLIQYMYIEIISMYRCKAEPKATLLEQVFSI